MIRWRLSEVMARHHIRGGALAARLNISQSGVSNLKTNPTLPRIGGERLGELCDALNALSDIEGELITPAGLMEYIPDSNP